MKPRPELLEVLDRWASARGLRPGFAAALVAACPWLGWEAPISEVLAPSLLEDALSPYGLDGEATVSLVAAYNSYVETLDV